MAQTDISTHTHSVSLISEDMVKAVLTETKNAHVAVPGVKATMMFKHDEQRACDSGMFVRLNPRNRSLIYLVCENNPNAPSTIPTSATCCKALVDMMHIRNQTQSALLNSADGCSLFSEETPEPNKSMLLLQKRRRQQSHHEKKGKRATADSMTIEVEHKEDTHSIEVLRPIDIRDGLWVKYDADTMGLVVDFLRCSEWKDNQPDWGLTGVKGVWKLKEKGFIVDLRTVSNFGPKYRKVATLDEAVGALSEASQEPKADTDKVDDMDETIDVMEQDADQTEDPVDTQVDTQQSTAQSS